MLDTVYIYTTILGMAVATYLTRETPFLILGKKKLGDKLVIWLSFIPVSVMSALLLPELLIKKTDAGNIINISFSNHFLWVGILTCFIAYYSKNFFITVISGMAILALLRYFTAAV